MLEAQLSTKTNILVVDDRPEGLLAMEAVLSCDDFNLIKASSGREALNQCLYHDFAVILLDVQMPELDGFETARLIRKNLRSHGTPIIFVTAINKEARHINKGYESGAVDYIFKPLDPFVLKSKVSVFVDLFRKNLKIKQQAALLREIELQEKERQMSDLRQESLKRYMDLADAVPHGIVKVRPDGRIEYFNQRWRRYAGFESDIDWRLVIHPKDQRKFLVFWLKMSHQNLRTSQIEVRIRSAIDGVYRWHLVNVVAEVKDDKITGWIGTCTDIDSIKRTEESFRSQSQELNRSNKELENFAYVASHDLREPLHVVSSFTHILERRLRSKADNQEKEYIEFIKQATRQAQVLIKDLLEYSLIGRQKSFDTIDLSSVLKEVFANLKTTIEESGAEIEWAGLPTVKANRLGMAQLFQNLIVNAIKYRSEKIPEILITAESKPDMWIFSIKDNGIGIDPQFKERIFEMFQRLHPKSEYSGTGVGLAVCKKIVENHGGKIWVESQKGSGSVFYFTIRKNL